MSLLKNANRKNLYTALENMSSACPPLELKTGWNATKDCVCNDTFPTINCNSKITDTADCYGIQNGLLDVMTVIWTTN